jgi:hypothetical protein
VLNTLYAAVTLGVARDPPPASWLAAFFADDAKIGVETAFGPIFTAGLAWPPLPAAHIAGLAAGCCTRPPAPSIEDASCPRQS